MTIRYLQALLLQMPLTLKYLPLESADFLHRNGRAAYPEATFPAIFMSTESTPAGPEVEGPLDPREARRRKLERIIALGHDPWGSRFNGRASIQAVRSRVGEVQWKLESGELVDLPDPDADPQLDFRMWLSQQGKGELVGPQVRIAGRIMSSRDKGKLKFIDLQDQSDHVQLFIGKNQVGDENWELASNFDLGDLIGVDGQLRRTKTGEVTVFVQNLHFLCKALEPPPEKHHGLRDPELRQRMRYLDLAYNEGVRDRFLARGKIVQSIRTTLLRSTSMSTLKPM